jgi:4-oxalocrotonate tautomerase
MPFIAIKVFEKELSAAQTASLIHDVTEAVMPFVGEDLRDSTWVVVEEVKSGAWGRKCLPSRRCPGGSGQTRPVAVEVMAPGDPMFADQRVLVTGSGRGIGKAIAGRFAQGGARVQLVARSREELEATRVAEGSGLCLSRSCGAIQ